MSTNPALNHIARQATMAINNAAQAIHIKLRMLCVLHVGRLCRKP